MIPKLKILQGDLFTTDSLITSVNFLVIRDMPVAIQANKQLTDKNYHREEQRI
jgi:hypothetical protein